MTTVMGVDVGGTKALAASVDRGGNLLTLCLESGLDPTASKKPRDDLHSLLHRLVDTTASHPEYMTLGLPYYDEIDRVSEMQVEVTRSIFGQRALVCNDVEIAHIGAFAGEDGVLCLAGTGSMAWAKGPGGTARSGGYGDVIGDEGSAFQIGRSALALLSREADGRHPASSFALELARECDINPNRLIEWVYRSANPRAEVAGIALQVSKLASAGNEIAGHILREAGAELALLAKSAAKAAGLPPDAPWSCAGSVFNDVIVKAEVTRRLGSEPVLPVLPPVGGALFDAATRAGWNIDENWISTLRPQLIDRNIA